VVARDQLRLIVRTFRDKVPKTLVFAKDDSHAEDIVEVIREEFGRGNDFCTKITYKSTGARPEQLIQEFRGCFNPRVAVTVDMIATGTDIRAVEIVMFLRAVDSRVLYEQMKGRGVRVIDPTELTSVTPGATAKTHFVIVDCVGVTETDLADTQPLERKKSVALKRLLEHVAMGGTDPDTLSSLASRLSRLDRRCSDLDRERIASTSGGATLRSISHAIVEALDPDRQIDEARSMFHVPEGQEPTAAQVKKAAERLGRAAIIGAARAGSWERSSRIGAARAGAASGP
jgi:type I restriction enzyme, R subunit